MGLLDGIRGKLNDANEALADAHKAWKDDSLTSRQTAIEAREAAVAAREDSVRALEEICRQSEARWVRRKLGFGLVAFASAVPAVLVGIAIGARTAEDVPMPIVTTAEQTGTLPTAVTPQSEASPKPVARVSEIDVKSISGDVSFDECIQQIQNMSENFSTPPINIIESSVLRVVRFVATDGSVLVSCSKLDRKMVVTRSPYK